MYDTETNISKFCKFADLKVGDIVKVDAGFDCLKAGAQLEVKAHPMDRKLGVMCDKGFHNLESQVDDENGVCVGIWKVPQV